MKNFPRRFVNAYFASWWLPSTVMLCVLLAVILTIMVGRAFPYSKPLELVGMGLLVLFGLTLIGIPSAAIWNLIRKRWVKGLINLSVVFLVLIAAIPLVCSFLFIYRFLGPSEDGFADELTIPQNIEISEPLDGGEDSPGGPEDGFQARLLTALKEPGNEDASISVKLPSLFRLHKNAPDALRRYLATSPSWRLFTEKGSLFATRRWMLGSNWRYTLHGYYSGFRLGFWSSAGIPNFQSRLTLGFAGKPWARFSGESTSIQHGQTKRLTISGGNRILSSHCVITSDDLVVEVFEQSETRERRLTKASLLYIEEELRPLAKAPEFSTIQTMLPSGAIRHGQPTIVLRNSFQPGIYDSEIWVNPGEPGMIYLKAYEVTEETPLSVNELRKYANEWIGWSDDPSQLFFSNTHFTIYEGDWGEPYAARFEVWFVPDSGEPERKLMEKNFKIEGWQR